MPSALPTDIIFFSAAAMAIRLPQDVSLSSAMMPVDLSNDAALLWLFEVTPTEASLSPLVRQAIATANVVIYDRPLAAIVAAALPLGDYAEPAASSSAAPDRTIERCLRFVLDGWSVVWLADLNNSMGQRVRRICQMLKRWAARNVPDDLPVLLFTDTDGGRYRRVERQIGALDAEVFAADASGLTIIFSAVAMAAGRRLRAVMSNGLAG